MANVFHLRLKNQNGYQGFIEGLERGLPTPTGEISIQAWPGLGVRNRVHGKIKKGFHGINPLQK